MDTAGLEHLPAYIRRIVAAFLLSSLNTDAETIRNVAQILLCEHPETIPLCDHCSQFEQCAHRPTRIQCQSCIKFWPA